MVRIQISNEEWIKYFDLKSDLIEVRIGDVQTIMARIKEMQACPDGKKYIEIQAVNQLQGNVVSR